jgi:hypothetical protein
MDSAEVRAGEVRQYVGHGVKALVPKVIGQTAAALRTTGGSARLGKRQWDEASFFAELKARRGPEEAEVAQPISDVNGVLAGGNCEATLNLATNLNRDNTRGCPLN